MCWYTSNKKYMDNRVADNDIPVVKVVKASTGVYLSVYRDYPYKIGETYTADIESEKDGWDYPTTMFINRGIHSYHEDINVNINVNLYNNTTRGCPFKYAVEIFYSNRYRLDDFLACFPHEIVKLHCVIPSGATYYLNEKGEYVSDKLKVISAEPIIQ